MSVIAAQPAETLKASPAQPAEEWLGRKEAAKFLTSQGYPISNRTLEHLAYQKKGPRYRRFGWSRTRYAKSELLDWARSESVEGGRAA